jgi:hypothetical protein
MGNEKCIQNFSSTPKGKRQHARLRSIWKDDIKMHLKLIMCVRFWIDFVWLRIEETKEPGINPASQPLLFQYFEYAHFEFIQSAAEKRAD